MALAERSCCPFTSLCPGLWPRLSACCRSSLVPVIQQVLNACCSVNGDQAAVGLGAFQNRALVQAEPESQVSCGRTRGAVVHGRARPCSGLCYETLFFQGWLAGSCWLWLNLVGRSQE